MTTDPKNLLAEGMRGSDGHLLQQSFGEEERGHHLHKPLIYQRIHQDPFQFTEHRSSAMIAQLRQALSAFFNPFLFQILKRLVSLPHIGERPFQQGGGSAQFPQALFLNFGQGKSHLPGSSSSGHFCGVPFIPLLLDKIFGSA
jgi:hypothetical protein